MNEPTTSTTRPLLTAPTAPPGGAAPGSGRARTVVAALVEERLVDEADADRAVTVAERALAGPRVPAAAQPPARFGALVEIAGYAGGALVLAALGLFLVDRWGGFTRGERLVAVAAISAFLLGAGVVVGLASGGIRALRHDAEATRRRLASTLLAMGALAAGTAAGMAVDLWAPAGTDGEWAALAGAVTVVAVAAAAYLAAPSVLAQLVLLTGSTTAVTSGLWLVAQPGDPGDIAFALGLLAVAAAWLAAATTGWLRERTVAHALGAATALVGAQWPVGGDHAAVAYLLTAAVALGGFAWYLRGRSWPFLAAGVVGVTIVVPEAVVDWTDGSLGVAGAVLVTGLTLLAASLAGFRASRRSEPPEHRPGRTDLTRAG